MMKYFNNGAVGLPQQTPPQAPQAPGSLPELDTSGLTPGQDTFGAPPVGPEGLPLTNPTPNTRIAPMKKRSLMDMVEEYRAKIKSGRDGMAVDAEIPPAKGVDTVPARIAEGEAVLNREATALAGGENGINAMNAEGLALRDQGIDPNMEPHGYIAPGSDGTDGVNSVTPNGEPVLNLRDGAFVNYFNEGTGNSFVNKFTGQNVSDALGGLATANANYFRTKAGLDRLPTDKDATAKQEAISASEGTMQAAKTGVELLDAGAASVLNYRNSPTVRAKIKSAVGSYLPSSLPTGLDAGIVSTLFARSDADQEKYAFQYINEHFKNEPEKIDAYHQFLQSVKTLQLQARKLVKGGSVSDSEAKAAADTVTNLDAPASAIRNNLINVYNSSYKSATEKGYNKPAHKFIAPVQGYGEFTESQDSSVALPDGVTQVTITPETIAEGQRFVDGSEYEYEVYSEDGKAFVKITNDSTGQLGPYELSYNESEQKWYVDSFTGRTYLTAIQ